eukprot:scaffold64_cov338-Pavlova_lutheri.AAC.62
MRAPGGGTGVGRAGLTGTRTCVGPGVPVLERRATAGHGSAGRERGRGEDGGGAKPTRGRVRRTGRRRNRDRCSLARTKKEKKRRSRCGRAPAARMPATWSQERPREGRGRIRKTMPSRKTRAAGQRTGSRAASTRQRNAVCNRRRSAR